MTPVTVLRVMSDPLHDVEAGLVVHPAEDDVFAVEPVGLDGGYEELGPVGVGAGVGHGEEAGGAVLHQEVLVVKLGSVDGLAASPVKPLEVSSLNREVSLPGSRPAVISPGA